MSWSTEVGVLCAASALFAGGCYDSHLCGSEEVCNLRDDDCDGLVDEGFVYDDGVYRDVMNCGTCGVRCDEAFPTAGEVACEDDPGMGPTCVIVSCAEGFHRSGDGSCAPDVPVLCLPCTGDEDCALRVPGARCLPTGSGQSRCGQPCGAAGCPEGFECADGQCAPRSGFCACDETTVDTELACLLRVAADGHACVGVRVCGADGPGPCEPALVEA